MNSDVLAAGLFGRLYTTVGPDPNRSRLKYYHRITQELRFCQVHLCELPDVDVAGGELVGPEPAYTRVIGTGPTLIHEVTT